MKKKSFYLVITFLTAFCIAVSAQVPDNTYGPGGTVQVHLEDNKEFTVRTETYKDANGTIRHVKTVFMYRSGFERVADIYYDCKGKYLYNRSVGKDSTGQEAGFEETVYENGKAVKGNKHGHDPFGRPFVKSYHATTQEWQDESIGYYDASMPNGKYSPDTTPCPPRTAGRITGNGDADLYIGFSLIEEDSKPKNFPTYGGTIGYVHPIGHAAGLAAQANINFGSNQGVDYRKISALGGLVVYPFKGADRNDKFQFSLEGMGGYINLHSNFGPVSVSSSGFILLVQPEVGMKLSEHTILQAGIGYNPTFINGQTSNNYDVNLRFAFRFGF